MKYLAKPFWYSCAYIHLLFKISVAVIQFLILVVWHLSITDAYSETLKEFDVFYKSAICKGGIIMYEYKTMKDFMDGKKSNDIMDRLTNQL